MAVKVFIAGKLQARNVLGRKLRELSERLGVRLRDLLVMAKHRDPFNLDKPDNRAAGSWFRDQMQACGVLDRERPIHNRGVHYAILGLKSIIPSGKLKGTIYGSDDPPGTAGACWEYLEATSKAARWLGYVPFEKISDERNAPPIIRLHDVPQIESSLHVPVWLPRIDDFKPRIDLDGFEGRQPHRLVFWGEKTSLDDVLSPLAEEYGADLYLPTGEVSETMLGQMARAGAADGREMVVFVFADCDPSGYQMGVSIGHKLRGFQEDLFPALRFRLLTPGLTVEQVKDLDLPSTPLKMTEKRAAGWKKKHGVEQTEIDALATLQPDVLEEIVREAVDPYFDETLEDRVDEAGAKWKAQAQAAINAHPSGQELADLRAVAEERLAKLKETLDQIKTVVDDLDVELPEFDVPQPVLKPKPVAPLVSSDMPLIDHIRILQERKRYDGEESDDAPW